MNFIFLTTMIILIFTLVSSSMTSSLKTTVSIYKEFNNIINEEYKVHNKIAIAKYKNTQVKAKKKSTKEIIASRKKIEFKGRSNKNSENSKLNLFPLINTSYSQKEKKVIKDTLERLVHNLYKREQFYIKKIKDNPYYLKAFIRNFSINITKYKSLAKIDFLNPEDRKFFVQICKGSYQTKYKRKPLLNYITLQHIEEKPSVIFSSMSSALLYAYFGDHIAGKILRLEKSHYEKGRKDFHLSKKK